MLDLIILIVLVLGLVRGLFTGAVRQVTSIIGLAASFVLAIHLMYPVGELLVEELAVSPRVGTLIAFVLVFGVIELTVFLVTRLLEKLLTALHLSVLNRAAGGAIGTAKAAFILSILFLLLGLVDVPGEPARTDSRLYAPVASVAPAAWDLVSGHLPGIKAMADELGAQVTSAMPLE